MGILAYPSIVCGIVSVQWKGNIFYRMFLTSSLSRRQDGLGEDGCESLLPHEDIGISKTRSIPERRDEIE